MEQNNTLLLAQPKNIVATKYDRSADTISTF